MGEVTRNRPQELIKAVISWFSEQEVCLNLTVAEAVWVFHSVSAFWLSGPTSLVSIPVYLKAAVKSCTMDLFYHFYLQRKWFVILKEYTFCLFVVGK